MLHCPSSGKLKATFTYLILGLQAKGLKNSGTREGRRGRAVLALMEAAALHCPFEDCDSPYHSTVLHQFDLNSKFWTAFKSKGVVSYHPLLLGQLIKSRGNHIPQERMVKRFLGRDVCARTPQPTTEPQKLDESQTHK